MTCRSCKPREEWDAWDRQEGCIGGIIYGWCSSDACGGLCEDHGRCDCECHRSPL